MTGGATPGAPRRQAGDPATGRVLIAMTAEGEDVEPEELTIRNRSPPHSVAADTAVGEQTWHLRFELSHQDGVTTLLFAQLLGDDDLGSVGPGWEYYLDRLAAAIDGGDVGGIDWETYFPALSEYYTALAE